jgi:hypothetical protein
MVGQQQLMMQQKVLNESMTPSPSYGPGTSTFMDTFRGSVMSTIQQPSCERSVDISPSPGERSRNSPNIAVSSAAQRVLSSPMQQSQLFERTLPHALHNNYSYLHHQNTSLTPTHSLSPNFLQTCVTPVVVPPNSSSMLLPPYLQTLYNQQQSKSNDIQLQSFFLQ